MSDTLAASPTPVPAAPAAPAPAVPTPISAPATGEQLVSVKGLQLALDPGDAWPLGHPAGADLAPVPPGSIDERAADPSKPST